MPVPRSWDEMLTLPFSPATGPRVNNLISGLLGRMARPDKSECSASIFQPRTMFTQLTTVVNVQEYQR
jgi:hypothetical protein